STAPARRRTGQSRESSSGNPTPVLVTSISCDVTRASGQASMLGQPASDGSHCTAPSGAEVRPGLRARRACGFASTTLGSCELQVPELRGVLGFRRGRRDGGRDADATPQSLTGTRAGAALSPAATPWREGKLAFAASSKLAFVLDKTRACIRLYLLDASPILRCADGSPQLLPGQGRPRGQRRRRRLVAA